jgi:4-cresol dehydrogenase (hydroxylating)
MKAPPLDTAELHARLATVVGSEHVGALDADAWYGGLLGAHVAEELRPRALVRPASAEQLQRLAPMVAELGHGLWSSANACGNGAQRGHPRKPGVLVNLERMNRIVEVDRRGAYAVLEAGVSFAALAAELQARDLPLWLDADANEAHSVVGSIASRALGLTPYGDRQAALCGLEAVLANGTLLRTGMGALPGSACWPRYKYNFGPALDGLFSRAHFGIVTRVGLWLMPAPRKFLPFARAVPDLAGVAALIERLRPLQLDGSVSGRLLLASRASDAALLMQASGGEEPGAGAPPWTLYGALYGLPAQLEHHAQPLGAALGSVPSAGAGAVWALRARQLRGESLYAEAQGRDAGAVSFRVLAPATGADALALHHRVFARLADFAPRLAFMLVPRLLVLEVEVPATATANAAAAAAALAAIKDLATAGYGLHSTSPALEASVAARHTPSGLRHLHDGLHTALDPFATLAARGKFGAAKRRGKA